ncbi:MAG: energy transducer TonB [Gemmatimonadetes bacterium]|nr:energy transducer TonB [Gemmatimonadota bacterium]
MRAPRESRPPLAQVDATFDRASEERTTRMAWSMMAAVAVHAAAIASWPDSGALLMPVANLDAEVVAAQPEWLFLDQTTAGGPKEGEGVEKARSGAGRSEQARGVAVVDPNPIPEGISEDMRDRLVRATSFAPTVSDVDGPNGVATPGGEDSGDALRGSGLAGLAPTDYEALQGLSALDLERLSAVAPEVALEASSNWVLVRNPTQVKDFIVRHGARMGERQPRRGAASVAIWVSAAGLVEWAEIITSSGRGDWDELALQLFNDIVMFRPARLEGVPMPMSAIFTVDFPW